MKTFRTGLILVVGGILCWSTVCSAQNFAQIPYRHLIKMAQGETVDKKATSFKMNISSSLEGVKPEDIELILNTSEGPRYLIVDKEGTFEIPNSTMLFDENPTMMANQPRGTLNIKFKMEVPPFEEPKIAGGQIAYQELFKPVDEMQKYVKNIDPTFGTVGKNQFALEIRTDQPIRFLRKMIDKEGKEITGSRTFRPYNGVILLIKEAHLMEDDKNTIVEIPGKVKMNLIPVSAQQAERIKASW